MLITSKAFVVFPVNIQNGRMKWLIMTDDNRSIGKLYEDLADEGYDITIERVTKFHGNSIQTDRQEEVIRTAFSLGYFDYPKKLGVHNWLTH
jgi:predicted DNA binding protein